MFKRKGFYSFILLMIIFLVYMFVKEYPFQQIDNPLLEMPKK